MPDQVQLRGGTEGENDAFTGVAREVTVDTTNKTLRIHDGTTAGGSKLAAYDAWGRLQVADPQDDGDAASKGYVDTQVDSAVTAIAAIARRSTAQSITNDALNFISFDNEELGTDGFIDIGVAPTRITIPAGKAGLYDIVGSISFATSSAAGTYREVRVRKNGSTNLTLINQISAYAGTQTITKAVLADGDYLELGVYQDSGSAVDSGGSTYLAIHRIGSTT